MIYIESRILHSNLNSLYFSEINETILLALGLIGLKFVHWFKNIASDLKSQIGVHDGVISSLANCSEPFTFLNGSAFVVNLHHLDS